MGDLNRVDLFRDGLPFDGDIDVDWFVQIPSADVAEKRLDFLRTPGNVYDLLKRGYGGAPIERMWKAVFRACLSYDVVIPTSLHGYARELGVVIP